MKGQKLPDPTWRARQAFIRATRRGSKKHTSMEGKLQLLDAATAAIPQPPKVEQPKFPRPGYVENEHGKSYESIANPLSGRQSRLARKERKRRMKSP